MVSRQLFSVMRFHYGVGFALCLVASSASHGAEVVIPLKAYWPPIIGQGKPLARLKGFAMLKEKLRDHIKAAKDEESKRIAAIEADIAGKGAECTRLENELRSNSDSRNAAVIAENLRREVRESPLDEQLRVRRFRREEDAQLASSAQGPKAELGKLRREVRELESTLLQLRTSSDYKYLTGASGQPWDTDDLGQADVRIDDSGTWVIWAQRVGAGGSNLEWILEATPEQRRRQKGGALQLSTDNTLDILGLPPGL
jgi:hypothetical protein